MQKSWKQTQRFCMFLKAFYKMLQDPCKNHGKRNRASTSFSKNFAKSFKIHAKIMQNCATNLQVIDVADRFLALATLGPALVSLASLLHHVLLDGAVASEGRLPPRQFDRVVGDLVNFEVTRWLRGTLK